MSIRSHYTKDSYMNRPRRVIPEPNTESDVVYEDKAPCEACKNCEYKQLVEAAMEEDEKERNVMSYKIQPLPARATMQVPQAPIQYPQQYPQQAYPEQYPQQQYQPPQQPENGGKKPGLFKRFGDYVARNQAANKAAGETSLTDDLMSFGKTYGKGLSEGAARVAGEEISKIDKQRSIQRTDKEDDDLINYLSGKKSKK
jgi:hypothetical protein